MWDACCPLSPTHMPTLPIPTQSFLSLPIPRFHTLKSPLPTQPNALSDSPQHSLGENKIPALLPDAR
jgi:hypothetical protein